MYEERLHEIETTNTNVHAKVLQKHINKLHTENYFWKKILESFSVNEIKIGLEDEISKTMEYNDKLIEDATFLYRKVNKQNYEISTLRKKIWNKAKQNKTHKKKFVLKCKKNDNSNVIFKLKHIK